MKSIRILWMNCILPVLLAATLAGCSSLIPEREPLTVYRLPENILIGPYPDVAELDVSLQVETLKAGDSLAGRRIVVFPEGDRLSSYKGAAWSDPAPVLLRNRFVETFQQEGHLRALSDDDTAIQTDFILSGTLRKFQVEYREGVPEVLIEADLRLVRMRSRTIVATHRFAVSQTVQGKEVSEVVEAFGRAADILSAGAAYWTLRQLTEMPQD